MILSFACKIAGHKVDRRRVWNDYINFRTNCVRCGTPLLRGMHGWREFDPKRDYNIARAGHPDSGVS